MADDLTTPAPTPVAQVQPGPWQQDIQSTFTDPETAAAVDAFLRQRVQPRVTQLEQQLAGTADATQLLTSFQEDPIGTFNAVRQQLIEAGYPVAQATEAAQGAYDASQQQPAAPAPTAAQTAAAAQEDPRVAEMYAAWTEERELAAYDAQVAEIVNDPANADINPNRYHTFVAAADGDFQKALDLYRADVAQVLRDYGIDPLTATPQQQESAAAIAEAGQQANAPAVMGSGSGAGAGAPIPTQPEYRGQDGLNKAIDDAVAAMVRKGPAPPVA